MCAKLFHSRKTMNQIRKEFDNKKRNEKKNPTHKRVHKIKIHKIVILIDKKKSCVSFYLKKTTWHM